MKLIQFTIIGFILLSIIVRYIYGSVDKKEKHFILPVILILAGVFLSSITAYAYHNQNFIITFWAQAAMYWYIFYIFLSVNDFKREELERYLITFGIMYGIFYWIQYIIFPTLIFDVRIDDDIVRGTLRIFLPGYVFLAISYCIILNRFLRTNKLIYLLPLLLFFSVTLLQASRQYIVSLLLITLFGIFFTKKVKSRGLIILLIALSLFPIYLIFEDLIMNIINISDRAIQGTDPSANQRPTSIRYFMVEFPPSVFSYIFGNGEEHGSSPYGIKMIQLRRNHLFLSDVGIIGEYFRYGVLFVLGVLMLLYKFIKYKLSPDLNYVKFYALYMIILIPLARSFTPPAQIVVLCIIFYIIDLHFTEKKNNNIMPS